MGCHGGGSASKAGRGETKKASIKYTTADRTVQEVQARTIQGGYNTNRETIAKVLEVTAKGNGEISLKENYGTVIGGSRKYPVTEYNIKRASIITDKDYKTMPESEGINWDNVKVISGSTYGIGSLVKPKGFKWNGEKGVWEK